MTKSSIDLLHSALRRYCEAGFAEWTQRYQDLLSFESEERKQRGDGEPTTYTYSPDAYAIFPRYHVHQAILIAIEAFTPDDFESLEEARSLLSAAGETAQSIFTEGPSNDIEQRAMDEERQKFVHFARTVSEDSLARTESLPFRRTLTQVEGIELRAKLRERWGVEDAYWYPIDRPETVPPPPDAVAFMAEPFFADDLQMTLRRILGDLQGPRLFELRESGFPANRELDLTLFEPTYNGNEGLWTNGEAGWLIYASHESSVTVAGAHLVQELKSAWPQWPSNLYAPPDYG
jgi:hypothetical protein